MVSSTSIFVVSIILFVLQPSRAQDSTSSDHPFDVLIFTQQWPVTTCIEWKEQNPSHSCLLPSPKEMWTIHGVWPTRLGTIGPSFCNKTAVFDPDQLAPIADQLHQFWINIENGQTLWKHEWLKHGTCASVLPQLSNENKYFGRGLSWLHQYSMSSILSKSRILPDTRIKAADIYNAVAKSLNRNPFIHCIRDRHTHVPYLSEIRICFNKRMELVSCDGIKQPLNGENANLDDGLYSAECGDDYIEYPSVMPPSEVEATTTTDATSSTWQFPWLEVYKLLNLIRSVTL